MYYENIPPILELEANLDFVNEKARECLNMIEVVEGFKEKIEEFGLRPVPFHNLLDHLYQELLLTDTERQVFKADIEKEKFLQSL